MTDPTQVQAPSAEDSKGGRRRDKGRKAAESSAASATVTGMQATNRREIPLSSFDFTDGAYKVTIRARRVSFAVLSMTVLLLLFVAYQIAAVRSQVAVAQADLDALSQRETQVVESLGAAAGGVDPRMLITRSAALEESLAMAAQFQGDFRGILGEIYKVQVPGVSITDVRIGAGAMSLDRGETLNPNDGIPIRITAASKDLLSTVTWADQIRRLPMFASLQPEQNGSASVLTGYIVPSAPASVLLERLAGMGVTYKAPSRSAAAEQTQDESGQAGEPAGGSETPAGDGEAAPTEEAQ